MKAGILICGLLLGAIVWGAFAAVPTTWSQEPPPAAEGGDAPEVLTRGPIHEAYAEPLTDPEPGILVPKRPPADIDEVPPEFAPDLEGAIWIKGYWAWDDEREDFIWISGVHRVPPPGMRWMAGFWDEVEGKGWQWNRGFWIKADVEELSYRDAPPPSLEEGPSSPSPGDDYFYVPGHWAYDTDYRWSPGYWAEYRPDWVWVPAHWVWTPCGYVFVPGYCDYGIARRGCLYAPVYFRSAFYARPGYYYRPWCALNVGNLMVHLWVRPNYCHYYFGNYYGGFGSFGLTPWYQWGYHHRRHCYDPILAWSHVHYHRRGINYIDRIGGWHRHYERHEHDRPPRTWNDQVKLVSQTNITNITQINKVQNVAVRQNFLVAKVDDMAQVQDSPVRLKKLNAAQQEAAKKNARLVEEDIVQIREQRRKFERATILPVADKTGDVAQAAPTETQGAKGGKTGDAADAGAKGRGAKGGGKAGADVAATARGATRVKMKLPESKVKPIVAQVEVPAAPSRGTARTTAGGGKAAKSVGANGGGTSKGAQGDLDAATRDTPSGAKGKGRQGGGGDKTPQVESPKVALPDNQPAGKGKSAKGAAKNSPTDSTPRIQPRERAPREIEPREITPREATPREVTPGELPRIDRSPKREGGGKGNKSEAGPRLEAPAIGPAENLPSPRTNVPKNIPPKSNSGGASAAPRVTRPAASPQPGNVTPRSERSVPQPRVATPRAEPRVTTPRAEISRPESRVTTPRAEVSRPQPPAEVSRPQPRVSAPRPQNSRPAPRSEPRGSSRKRD